MATILNWSCPCRRLDEGDLALATADERPAERGLRRDPAGFGIALERPDQLVYDPGAGVEVAKANPFAEVDDAVAGVRLGDLRRCEPLLEPGDPRLEQRLLLAGGQVVRRSRSGPHRSRSPGGCAP